MSEVLLFAGPSAVGLDPVLIVDAGVTWRPPVQRGDIHRLLRRKSRRAGTIVLCDGAFQSVAAVSHAEICDAIDAGWQLWGVSSMGAIRAHELRTEGMRGHGYVHAQFQRHADFMDDEMCLLHFPDAPYFQVTEALVNLRYALEQLGPVLQIHPDAAAGLIHALRQCWFGERTEALIRQWMRDLAGFSPAQIEAVWRWLPANRIKNLDLASLLATRPWQA